MGVEKVNKSYTIGLSFTDQRLVMIGLKENRFETELPVKLIPLTWELPAVPEVTPLIVPACVEVVVYKYR